MSRTAELPRRKKRRRRCGLPESTAPAAPTRSWSWRWPVLLLLAGWLVFCHGCHAGDHDDELAVILPERR